MGKKTSNLTGLSRYVLDALKASQDDPGDISGDLQAATVPDPNLKHQDAYDAKAPPPKRRKTGSAIAGSGKYDATGLVPHYRDAYQVPEHLQKCEFSMCLMIPARG